MHTIAVISLLLAAVCALIITIDVLRHPQRMFIMNIVWPVTGLYGGPLALWTYFRIGRATHQSPKPFWQTVLTGTLHCGSGCTLGDLLSAGIRAKQPISLLGSSLIGGWTLDFVLAFLIGILFQYYAIRPMKKLSPRQALIAALRADALSLTFWQIGMYGWMAVSIFLLFHHPLNAGDLRFWFMMQLAMLTGLATALPINRWLLKKGIKEAM